MTIDERLEQMKSEMAQLREEIGALLARLVSLRPAAEARWAEIDRLLRKAKGLS
jgi:hypothetical protein